MKIKVLSQNMVFQDDICVQNALKLTYEHLQCQKISRELRPLDPQGRGEKGGEEWDPQISKRGCANEVCSATV